MGYFSSNGSGFAGAILFIRRGLINTTRYLQGSIIEKGQLT